MRKAVVTGAGGFIGGRLVEYLAESGWDVVAVGRPPAAGWSMPAVTTDLRRPGVLDKFLDAETVLFHLAASADVAGSVADPRQDFADTFETLFEALESARRTRCRLIYPSTASIFDSSNCLPVAETAYVRPSSPYGAAKAAGEAYCTAYHRAYGLDTRVARLFSAYGVGMTRFAIHDIIRKLQANPERIEILGDGNQVRDYLYIDDVVRGLVTIASCGAPGEDYNLASGEPVRIVDLAQLIARLMGYPDAEIAATGRSFPGDTPRWYADISKIQKIGFRPAVDLTEGLRRTIDWVLLDMWASDSRMDVVAETAPPTNGAGRHKVAVAQAGLAR